MNDNKSKGSNYYYHHFYKHNKNDGIQMMESWWAALGICDLGLFQFWAVQSELERSEWSQMSNEEFLTGL